MIKDFNDAPLKGPTSIAYNKQDNVLYFSDAGNFMNESLYPCNGSLFAVDLDSKIMRPLMFNSLSYPADILYDQSKGYIYIAETFANRVIRMVQNPDGVFHSSVFHQFNGRVGPSALAMDESGNLYVARYEFQIGLDLADTDGLISVLNSEGTLIGELTINNYSEITGLLISHKKKEFLYFTDRNSTNVFSIKLTSFISDLERIQEQNKAGFNLI